MNVSMPFKAVLYAVCIGLSFVLCMRRNWFSFISHVLKRQIRIWGLSSMYLMPLPLFAQALPDTTHSILRQPDAQTWQKLKEDRAFQYERPKAKSESLWVRWLAFMESLVTAMFGESSGVWLAKNGLWLLLGLVVLGGGWVLLRMQGTGLFYTSGREESIDLVNIQSLHKIRFEDEIQTAVGQNQFREAVRWQYLKTLKQLQDRSLIQWRADKTNAAYINELASVEWLVHFKQLTRHFDYVWYGKRPIDAGQYDQIARDFEQFNERLAKQ